MNGYYPGKAQVILKFGVDKKGKAFNPQILKIQRTYYDYERDKYFHEHYREYWEQGIDYDYCKEEALRILSMARFVPAHKDGVAVCFEPIITIIYTYYAAPGYD